MNTQGSQSKGIGELITELRSGTLNFDKEARETIEAYVTTRVKEAERDLIILKSHTSYLAGTLEGILGEPHPYVLKHLPDLTTTTNGKETE